MLHKTTVLLLLSLLAKVGMAQSCSNNDVLLLSDQTVSSIQMSGYEIYSQYQITMNSDKTFGINDEFESDYSYMIVLCSPKSVTASAIELSDDNGIQLDYVSKTNEPDCNVIILNYENQYSGNYDLKFKIINNKLSANCVYISILRIENVKEN